MNWIKDWLRQRPAWPSSASSSTPSGSALGWQQRAVDWIGALLRRRPVVPPSDHQRAVDLIKAVDAGGLPLNPARVNAIARSLGLEVSTRAPVEETIERIRHALARMNA